MTELIVKGKQTFLGKEIPVVLGGFGSDKKCISDKTAAEIHGMREPDVRRRVTDNIKRFRENVDFIDMKSCAPDAQQFLSDLGYTQMQISKAEHIYILSERGYAKLIKIMDTDLAWEIHDKLIDEYFELCENSKMPPPNLEAEKIATQKKRAEAMYLNAQTRMYTTIMKTIDNKKLSPIAAEVFGIAALEQVTGKPVNYRPKCERTYSATEVGKMFGVSSRKVGKLANANELKTDEYGITVMDKSPYSPKEVTTFRYNQKAVDRIKELLQGPAN